MTGAQESRIGMQQGGREQSPLQQVLRAVDVGQNEIQQSGPLNESGFHPFPFRRVDEQGENIKIPDPFGAFAFAGEVIGDSMLTEQLSRPFMPLLQARNSKSLHVVHERLPVRPDKPKRCLHFIEGSKGREVPRGEVEGG